MPNQTADLSSELNAYAVPFIESGRYADTGEVLRAAMRALRAELAHQAETDALLAMPFDAATTAAAGDLDSFKLLRTRYNLHF